MGQNYVIMKKILLIISLVVAFAIGGNAQNKNVRCGLKLGPSFDWASAGSVDTKNEGMRMGFNVGLVLDRYFTEHVALSSGVNANFLRMKYQFMDSTMVVGFLNEVPVLVSRRVNATNIEVPVKVKVRFDVVDSFKAYVEAGGAFAFNVSDKGKDKYKYEYSPQYEDKSYVDCAKQYRTVQTSIVFGLGAEYQINRKWSVFAQITSNNALSNAFNRNMQNKTGNIIRSNFVGIEFGILF